MTTPSRPQTRAATPEESQTRAAATESPSAGTAQREEKFKVRQHPRFSARAHPDVLFEGSEKAARRYIEQNHPRGGEVFLEGGGKKQTFNVDDHDDLDQWRDLQEDND